MNFDISIEDQDIIEINEDDIDIISDYSFKLSQDEFPPTQPVSHSPPQQQQQHLDNSNKTTTTTNNNNINKFYNKNSILSSLLSLPSISSFSTINSNNASNGGSSISTNNNGSFNQIKKVGTNKRNSGNNLLDQDLYQDLNLDLYDLSTTVAGTLSSKNQTPNLYTPKKKFYSLQSFELYRSIVLNSPCNSLLFLQDSISYLQISLLLILNSINNNKKVLFISSPPLPSNNNQQTNNNNINHNNNNSGIDFILNNLKELDIKFQKIENYSKREIFKKSIFNSTSMFFYIQESIQDNLKVISSGSTISTSSTEDLNIKFDLIIYDSYFQGDLIISNFMKSFIKLDKKTTGSGDGGNDEQSILIVSNNHSNNYFQLCNQIKIEFIFTFLLDSNSFIKDSLVSDGGGKELVYYEIPKTIESFIRDEITTNGTNQQESNLYNELIIILVNNGILNGFKFLQSKFNQFNSSGGNGSNGSFNKLFGKLKDLKNEIEAGIGNDIDKLSILVKLLLDQLNFYYKFGSGNIGGDDQQKLTTSTDQTKQSFFKILIITSSSSSIDEIFKKIIKSIKIAKPFKMYQSQPITKQQLIEYNCFIVSIEDLNYSSIEPNQFSMIIKFDHFQDLMFSTQFINTTTPKVLQFIPKTSIDLNDLVALTGDKRIYEYNQKIKTLNDLQSYSSSFNSSLSSLSTTSLESLKGREIVINLKRLNQLSKLNNLFKSNNSNGSNSSGGKQIIANDNGNGNGNGNGSETNLKLSIEIKLVCGETFLQNRNVIQCLTNEYNIKFIERNLKCNLDLILDERNCMFLLNCGGSIGNLKSLFENITISIIHFEKCWVLIENLKNGITNSTIIQDLIIDCTNQFQNKIQFIYCWTTIETCIAVRSICENISKTSTIWDQSLEKWSERSWLLETESKHERFLSRIPGFNPFTSQLLLTWKSLEYLLFSKESTLKLGFNWVPNQLWLYMNKFLGENRLFENKPTTTIVIQQSKLPPSTQKPKLLPLQPKLPPLKPKLLPLLPKLPILPKKSNLPKPLPLPTKKTNNNNNNILKDLNLQKSSLLSIKKSFSTTLSDHNNEFKQTIMDQFLIKNNNNGCNKRIKK